MESTRIYGKTEQGVAALNAARGALSSPARQLLILVDGQRDVGELQGIFGADALDRLLPQLETQGYIRFVGDHPGASAGARPSTISRVQQMPAMQSAPQMATEAAAPAAPSGNVLAKVMLAAGVLAVSGTLWWFFGGGQIPGIAAPATGPDPAATPATTATPPAPVLAQAPVAQAPVPTPVPPPAPERPVRARDLNRAEARPTGPSSAPSGPPPAPPATAAASAPAPAAARSVVPAQSPATASSSPAATPGDAARAAALPPPSAGTSLAAGVPLAPAPAANPAVVTPATSPPPAPVNPPASSVAAAPPPPAAAPRGTAAAPTPAGTSAVARAPAATAANAPVLHPRERTMPVLSRSARRAGVDSGELVVRLHISARGTVDSIDVVKASPREVYDSTVEQTLKKWTYDPPGVPAESTVEFSFKS